MYHLCSVLKTFVLVSSRTRRCYLVYTIELLLVLRNTAMGSQEDASEWAESHKKSPEHRPKPPSPDEDRAVAASPQDTAHFDIPNERHASRHLYSSPRLPALIRTHNSGPHENPPPPRIQNTNTSKTSPTSLPKDTILSASYGWSLRDLPAPHTLTQRFAQDADLYNAIGVRHHPKTWRQYEGPFRITDAGPYVAPPVQAQRDSDGALVAGFDALVQHNTGEAVRDSKLPPASVVPLSFPFSQTTYLGAGARETAESIRKGVIPGLGAREGEVGAGREWLGIADSSSDSDGSEQDRESGEEARRSEEP
ncbi:hypothetical protein K491DRAFT_454425 [Lophiostoma macrostomum CBS 122681]|uniref:Uncharacterized protein n=1 Tax=Lophiostoma macrostomum CBS 122681 TaxID=1314788 RepID=A0A6A6TQ40_9PLEO|nr:hypothetical protein K491DRAFT_454425 [Lophiostoma macrostomum CBS 122681]